MEIYPKKLMDQLDADKAISKTFSELLSEVKMQERFTITIPATYPPIVPQKEPPK